ncbi:hypothetical protein ACIHFE_30855 [Streptomyces sp. NPDC052396]|uniref:hypothetical protein n=1 Tax=Streptomyces sp. NPDC052396 TaxID=3365689 RepID=UPI0037CF4071
MTVLAWSVVMATLGQTAAIATLVPSLGLLVQQISQAIAGSGGKSPATPTDSGSVPRDDGESQ